MGSRARAKWKQKMMKEKGITQTFPPGKKQSAVTPSTQKIAKLLRKAEEYVETFDYKSAKECCTKALRFDCTNLDALEMSASISLDLGNPETACSMLLEAVKQSPDLGHGKYFSLGQLSESKEALGYYHKGINIAAKLLGQDKKQDVAATSENSSSVRREISNAYCAMAELYLTDLCFEKDAEVQCKSFIDQAVRWDSSNPEASQCLANFQLTTGLLEEAKQSMVESLDHWLPNYKASRAGTSDESDPSKDCPLTYDARINTSKLLIELEMFDEVADVLDGLIDEDDEVVDAWYLLGWANYLRGEEYRGNARFYLDKASQVAAKIGDKDNEQLGHIEELLKELGPASDNEEDDKENRDQENEEDSSSSSEDEEMEQS